MPDGIATSRQRKTSKLLAVRPEVADPGKAKVLIFGKPNVGKTWTTLEFPSVYYMDTEGGAKFQHYRAKLRDAGGMYMGPELGSNDLETVVGQVQGLATQEHPYQTVAIDSASHVFNTAISEESERIIEGGRKDEFGASKKGPVRQMNRLLRWIGRVDMNVILIAHEKALWGKNDKGEREEIGVTFDCWDKLEYSLDLILHITKIGAGEHAKRQATVRKTRLLGFPEGARFDWSYAAFAERYGRDIIEREVQKEVLATPEQLARLKQLFETVRVPDDYESKCLAKAAAESWEEVETSKAQRVIEDLEARLQV